MPPLRPLALALAAALAAALALAPAALGAQTMTLSGDPATLVVRSAVAGGRPDPVSDGGTTYSLEGIAGGAMRITARLDAPLPPGVSLRVTLAPPPGAAGAGPVTLSAAEQDVVRRIPPGSWAGLAIRYELAAGVEAGTLALSAPLVTFTLRPDL